MLLTLEIIPTSLLDTYRNKITFDILELINQKSKEKIPFDNFQFYTSVSSVYSSKIEGENIDMDSYMKHKFLGVQYEPDYTKRADDLYKAYQFITTKELKSENVLEAHKILSKNLLAKSQRGVIRANPMFVINEDDRIEYVACEPQKVKREWEKLFEDLEKLLATQLSPTEVFYFAALIHLVFLKIHPFQDGNGRTARLIEKWFLQEKLGEQATAIQLEKNYYLKKQTYYDNIKKLGLEYNELDYGQSLAFLLMTVCSL